MTDTRPPVLIVGAGPVGLTTALLLAKRGIPCTILQRGPDIIRTGSRAIVLLRSTLEMLNEAAPGIGQTLAERGVTWRTKRTYYKNRLLFSETYPLSDDARYPLFVNVSQLETDDLLLKAVQRYPSLINIHFNHTVKEVHQTQHCVYVHTEEEGEFAADYVIGADGARSNVRKSLGVNLIGRRCDNRFLIADVQAKLDIDHERRFYYSPPSNPGFQAFMLPQPDNVWRLDWQVGLNATLEHETARLDTRIQSMIGRDVPYKIRWTSLYHFNNLRAEHFRVGRVFLAGDAAHLFSPFGGRGLNSGIADAYSLAKRLSDVIEKKALPEMLELYNTERQAAAIENLAATSRVLRILVPTTLLHRAARYLALQGSPYLNFCRRYVDSGPYAVKQKAINVSRGYS
ncbi:MAG: FAD-dependent monooxygenase [Pseudomonadota bacterium]